MNQNLTSQLSNSKGFTLIEALIAVVILAIGLLGIAGLQATNLKNNQSAYNRSQATLLAYDMADRIRANSSEANKFSTSQYIATSAPATQATCSTTAGCTPLQMAQNDRKQWNDNISSSLPSGAGTITVVAGTRTYTITITWDDNRNGDLTDDPNFNMSFRL